MSLSAGPFSGNRSYLQMLLYLMDFEELSISQTLKEFTVCDKESLAKTLWLSHRNDPKVGLSM